MLSAWPLALLAACSAPVDSGAATLGVGAETTPTVAPAPPDPSDPTIARRPFSAEEIRDAMPVGSWKRSLVETLGRPKVINVATVTSADDVRMTLLNKPSTEAGEPIGDGAEQVARWQELVEHATFPLEQTTLASVEIELPSGTWDCWLYTVTETTEDGREAINRFHFAKDLPGAPVRYSQQVDGKRTFLMVLLEKGRESEP